MHRLMVRPLIHGASRICVALDTKPLDKEEVESGTTAWAALLYQYGAQLDARVLVALWCAGVILPRVGEHFEAQKQKRAERLKKDATPLGPVVEGQVTGKAA